MADGRSTRLALDELLMKVAPENRVGVLREYGEMVPPPTVNLSTPDPRTDMIEWFRQRDREIAEKAVAAARAQIVGWLRFQEREWRDTSANLGSSVAGDVAAHYAQALHNAIESIESDAPERWAAEREGERG